MVTAVALTILLATASPATYEARSQHYALTIIPVEGGYKVRVTSLERNEVVLSEDLTTSREVTKDVGDLHFAVQICPGPVALSANLDVEEGEMLVDSVRTTWTTTPHRAHIRTPGAMRVGGDVKAPIVIHRVEPMYPEEARRNRVSGVTILEVLIDKTGVVKDALVLKPLPFGMSEAALDAVKQWIFTPATKDGQAVDVIFNLTVNFKIDNQPPPLLYPR